MERADIYEQLTEIFQDVFDDDELTIEDSTSAEDIEAWNSLNHLSLIMEVQEQFEIEFTSGQIFNLHNVGQLVELILQLLNGTAPRSESKDFPANFIQFQSGSNDKKPLFLLHPAGGTSFAFYRPLLAHLQTEQPIYGINVPEVDNQLRHFDNIEEMATQYIEGIRTIQPESPYYLVGGSLGGIPAFEIAQQLTKQGEEVAFIAVLDCPSSKQLPTLESDFDVMSMMVNNDNKLS
ncbi:MAG: thioesterase domain-containing protein, partial [Ekhidna sp.]